MKKSISTFVIYLCALSRLFGQNQESKPLVIGTSSGFAPFVSLNAQGEYEGFDIDIGRELSKRINRPLVLKDCGTMPSLMLALEQQKVDIILWGITITESRLKKIELVFYQGTPRDKIPVIFWKTIPDDLQTLEELGKNTNKPICVEGGSYQEEVLKSVPGISLRYLDTVTDVILDLKYGKSSASAIDSALIPRLKKGYPELQVKYFPLPKAGCSYGFGIGIKKTNLALALQVKQVISDLISEGKIAELEKKWGMTNGQ